MMRSLEQQWKHTFLQVAYQNTDVAQLRFINGLLLTELVSNYKIQWLQFNAKRRKHSVCLSVCPQKWHQIFVEVRPNSSHVAEPNIRSNSSAHLY